jgi:hypothetical protein
MSAKEFTEAVDFLPASAYHSLPAQETHRMSAKESTEAVDFLPASA